MTQDKPLFSRDLRVTELSSYIGRALAAEATAAERTEIAAAYDLPTLGAFAFSGEIKPAGDGVWRLKGRVTATLTQSCVVTLTPIEAKINEPIDRLFAERAMAAEEEVEIDPEADDPPDPLGAALDYGEAALEAFALALDPYPRAPGAAFAALSAAPPGVKAMTDEEAKPFAGLAALKRTMERGD